MKKLLPSLLALSLAPLCLQAQSAPKIAVVDMAKVYENYYKVQDAVNKLHANQAAAEQQYDQMSKDGQALVDQYNALGEKVKNPMTSPEAKTQAQADMQKKGEEIQTKMNERQQFAASVQRELVQSEQSFHELLMGEIAQKATEVGKTHSADLVLDKAAISADGAHSVIYSDSDYDVTAEVLAAVNKDRPATTSVAAPAAAGTPASGDTSIPQISVPGITPPAAK